MDYHYDGPTSPPTFASPAQHHRCQQRSHSWSAWNPHSPSSLPSDTRTLKEPTDFWQSDRARRKSVTFGSLSDEGRERTNQRETGRERSEKSRSESLSRIGLRSERSQPLTHVELDLLDEALSEARPHGKRHFSLSSLKSLLPSSSRQTIIHFDNKSRVRRDTSLEAQLGSSEEPLVPGHYPEASCESPSQSRRCHMRTVSRDDYLLARGANPRTGIITPSTNSDKNPFDEAEACRQRGVVPPSKWRLKGDEWISLGIGQPTPMPTPPIEPKGRFRPQNLRTPPKLSASQSVPIRDLRGRYDLGVPATQTSFPPRMGQQGPERIGNVMRPPNPASGFHGRRDQHPQISIYAANEPGRIPSGNGISRKAVGSPIKKAQISHDETPGAGMESIFKPAGRPFHHQTRATSAPMPTREYYSADDVGKTIPPVPTKHNFAPPGRSEQTQKPFLGLKGDWIEDVPSEVLQMPEPPEFLMRYPQMSSTQLQLPYSTEGNLPHRPKLPPRPLMSNAFENRSAPPYHWHTSMLETIPNIPSSKSWIQPPLPRDQRRAATAQTPYVVRRQPDAFKQEVFPSPQLGTVRNMQRRMEVISREDGRPNQQLHDPFNMLHTTTAISIPTTTGTRIEEPMEDSLFIPRLRPRGKSRPMLPPRAAGTVSVPQVSPRKADPTNTALSSQCMHQDIMPNEEFVPKVLSPNITITTASPERVTTRVNTQGQDHQKTLYFPVPTNYQCNHQSFQDPRHCQQKHGSRDHHKRDIAGFTHTLGKSDLVHRQENAVPSRDCLESAQMPGALLSSPAIGMDLTSADPDFLHHDRCCPSCCAQGCHGSCLGHESPKAKARKGNLATVASALDLNDRRDGVGFSGFFGFGNRLRNSLRYRRSVKVTRRHHHRQGSGLDGGHMEASSQEEEEEQVEEIAEVDAPLPWEDPRTGTPVPLILAGGIWGKSTTSSSGSYQPYSKLGPSAQWAASKGKRITSNGSGISTLSQLSFVDLSSLNLNLGMIVEAMTVPFAALAMFLNTHPQIILLGKVVMLKGVEMGKQILGTVGRLWSVWWVYGRTGRVGLARSRRGGPGDIVGLVRDVVRSVVYALILAAVGVMFGKVLGILFGWIEWFVYIGRGVGWVVGGCGVMG